MKNKITWLSFKERLPTADDLRRGIWTCLAGKISLNTYTEGAFFTPNTVGCWAYGWQDMPQPPVESEVRDRAAFAAALQDITRWGDSITSDARYGFGWGWDAALKYERSNKNQTSAPAYSKTS